MKQLARLPVLLVRDTGPGTPWAKPKRTYIPGMGREKACTVPEEEVANIKWLLQYLPAHTVSTLMPARSKSYVIALRDELSRPSVQPRCPAWVNEAEWHKHFGTQP